MAIITYYLDEPDGKPSAILDKDFTKLSTAFKSKTTEITFDDKEVDGGKLKSQASLHTKFDKIIKSMGLSKEARSALDSGAKYDGKVTTAGDYDFFVTVKGTRLKGKLNIVFPVVVEKPVLKKGTDYSFENSAVERECDKNFMTKIESICMAGPSETGHGKVPFLDGALHAHVTHTKSLAWVWKGKKVHVVAVGTKNPKNPTQDKKGLGKGLKTMSYDWIEE